jgi:hypothetical protein
MTTVREVSGEQAAEPQVIVSRTGCNMDKPAPGTLLAKNNAHPSVSL